ncbi:MAG TPA: hypothetical protein PKL53_06700 [Methylotenera sp.]|nr:hypothetical protein [Methylotenera sp.]HPV44140.1 hypothetical protein [Methylotenera sp.]
MQKSALVLITMLFMLACSKPENSNPPRRIGPPDQVEKPSTPPDQIVCTHDAKQCADGSSVGRSGPNCEFVCK